MKAWVILGCLALAGTAGAADTNAKTKTDKTNAVKPAEPAPERVHRAEGSSDETATAELKNTEGKQVGEVKFEQVAKGVILHVRLWGIPEGEHAIHIHERGQCEAPFKSAGGHYNPLHHQHGIENVKGMHAGDFPNLKVPKSGEFQTDLFTNSVTVTKGKLTLFDGDGSSVVIHAGADDYMTDPAGNAGDRIACGVIHK